MFDVKPLLTIKDVCMLLQRSKASIYRDIDDGSFPKPLKLKGSSRWTMSDIESRISGAR
ncbi:helix-turn-helix transcriptional regulator [Sulfitobacter guttiformis]|nr:AlpA family phage regulatory protein [Sulfitobacter guttiformis]KIN71458.1 Transcriptional regulator, AlpA family [Sulfitobacter guttiformis KCTC 32187]